MYFTFSKGALPHPASYGKHLHIHGNIPIYTGNTPHIHSCVPVAGEEQDCGQPVHHELPGQVILGHVDPAQRQDNDWQMDRPSALEAKCHIQG